MILETFNVLLELGVFMVYSPQKSVKRVSSSVRTGLPTGIVDVAPADIDDFVHQFEDAMYLPDVEGEKHGFIKIEGVVNERR